MLKWLVSAIKVTSLQPGTKTNIVTSTLKKTKKQQNKNHNYCIDSICTELILP